METTGKRMDTTPIQEDETQMVAVYFKLDKDSLRALRVKAAGRDQVGVSALLRDMVKRELAQN